MRPTAHDLAHARPIEQAPRARRVPDGMAPCPCCGRPLRDPTRKHSAPDGLPCNGPGRPVHLDELPVHMPRTRTFTTSTAPRQPEKRDRPPGPRLYGECEECGGFVTGERRLCGLCLAMRPNGGRK